MPDEVASHYAKGGDLAAAIADSLRKAGIDIASLKTEDLSSVDEFHIRGRKATLELAEHLGLTKTSHVLDIGSGLGGPARTVSRSSLSRRPAKSYSRTAAMQSSANFGPTLVSATALYL